MNIDTLQHLPIVLEASWDCRPLALRDLLELRPGVTLPMGIAVNQPLQLRAGGELVGLADLHRSETGTSIVMRQFVDGL
jgi:hypothetical protein